MTITTTNGANKLEDIQLISTSAAREFIRKQSKDSTPIFFKIGIKKTGCSGFAYTFDRVEKAAETDRLFPQEDGITLCVESEALTIFKDTVVLDYVKHGLNKRLELINPNEKNRCGCGESVTF